MPNWIKSELSIFNLKPEEYTVLREIFSSKEPFQKIMPMPAILDDTKSPTPDCIYDILGMNRGGVRRIDPEFDFCACEDERAAIKAMGLEKAVHKLEKVDGLDEDDRKNAIQAVKAIEATGYANWYDWRIDNWGCKWDADSEISESSSFTEPFADPGLVVDLSTPWSPPAGIMKRLTDMYPEAVFKLRWADEDDFGNAQGMMSATAGVVTEMEIGDKEVFLKRLFQLSDDEYHEYVNP